MDSGGEGESRGLSAAELAPSAERFAERDLSHRITKKSTANTTYLRIVKVSFLLHPEKNSEHNLHSSHRDRGSGRLESELAETSIAKHDERVVEEVNKSGGDDDSGAEMLGGVKEAREIAI